jgi:hypothetical protein
MRRFAGAAAAVVVAVAGGAAPAEPAAAAGTAGYCADGNGVTVVVDFNELGGGVVIRCAPGDQATGLSALKNAGLRIAGTTRWGESFVCRIEGRPTVATEPCVDTPPASAYWSYWHASNGGSWTYSDKGVRNRKPPSGSFEGWSFSTGRTQATAPRPDAAPTRPAAPAPPPPPAGGGGAQPGGGGQPGGGAAPGGGGQPGQPGQPGAGAPGATTGAPAVTSPGPGSPGSPGATVPGSAAPGATAAGAAPGAPSDTEPVTDVATTPAGSSGMPVGTVAGLGLLVAFLVAAGITVWRRRRSPPGSVDADPGEA